MFHMTLLFNMQLLDELPMVWGGAYLLYSLYRARISFEEGGKTVGIILLCYAIIVSVAYLVNKNPIFHEVMYGILVTNIVFLAVKYQRIHYKKSATILFWAGALLYGVGFILWNVDNNFCNKITVLREQRLESNVALKVLSPLTQLHGWWHIMAGYATYLHILNCIQHRLHFLGIEYSIEGSWIGVSVRINKNQQRKLTKSYQYQDWNWSRHTTLKILNGCSDEHDSSCDIFVQDSYCIYFKLVSQICFTTEICIVRASMC